jgi:hypothetical protein
MLIDAPDAGILIPIPQYPLYTAALAQHHGQPIPVSSLLIFIFFIFPFFSSVLHPVIFNWH